MIEIIDQDFLESATELNDNIQFQYIENEYNIPCFKTTPILKNFENFKQILSKYPAFYPDGSNFSNPFIKQSIWKSQYRKLNSFLIDFFKYRFEKKMELYDIYTNIAQWSKHNAPLLSMYPHIDGQSGFACNFWLSAKGNDATSLYKVRGSPYRNIESIEYIFQEVGINENINFFNYTPQPHVDIERILNIPAENNTITIYPFEVFHTAILEEDANHIRWSLVMMYKNISVSS